MNTDIAKLLLRLTLGIMMLFHGVEKIINGISGVKYLVTNAGLPEFLAYGVYVGEVVFPILIILGLYARVASLGIAFNMLMAIFLAYGNSLFELNKYGAPVFELPFFYLITSIVIFLLGSGRYGVNSK
ncbi:DoxX family protein [Sulfurimonas sp.]|uniref:DoxX family protein n=1 Tax=Sulfurimonas sp. TaxID=2022749 RepID=UPI002AB0E60B|nr:DoxX family protein [Sulfurimonas sp.]